MQSFLKVLACAALSGALIIPQQAIALPTSKLQIRQSIGGSGSIGVSGSADGSLPGVPTLDGSLLDGSLPALPSLDGSGVPTLDGSLPDGSLPGTPSLDGSLPDGSLPGLSSLEGILPGIPSLADPTLPSAPSLTTPAIPSIPTGDFDPTAASAVYSSLSSAFASLPTPQAVAQAQAFQTFVQDTLEGLADVASGNNDFSNLPGDLTNSDGFNFPTQLPEPLTTLAAIFSNGLDSLFDAFPGMDDIPSPAIGVIPVADGQGGDASGDVSATSDANGNAATNAGGASASSNSADAGGASASSNNAGTGGVNVRRDSSSSFDFKSLLDSLTSAFDALIGSYGSSSFQSIIPTDVTRAIKKKL